MAGYLGTKAVFLSTTAANVAGTVTADGLTVDGDVVLNDQSVIIGSTANSYNEIRFFDSVNTGGTTRIRSDASDLGLYTANAERMRINSSGNVLVGTTSTIASADFTVNSAGSTRMNLASDGVERFGVFADSGIAALYAGGTSVMTLSTNATERMRIKSNGNVGIGATDPGWKLEVDNGANDNLIQVIRGAGNAYIGFGVNGSDAIITGGTSSASEPRNLAFRTANSSGVESEAMRIDSSGNLLVGKTTQDFGATGGLEFYGASGDSLTILSRASNAPLQVRRNTTDGDIVKFQKNGTTVGSIGTNSTDIYLSGTTAGVRVYGAGILPCNSSGTTADNQFDVGSSTVRWDDVYATNGTIQTSDRNEKQDIASLTPTEMLVAARLSTGFKNFRWKDSVAEKGAAARMHSGAIAQDVQDAFTAEGLDAGDYSMFISGTWWTHDVDVPAVEAVAEVVDEDGVVVTEAVEAVAAYTRTDTYDTEAEAPVGAVSKTRLGVRYPELLSFVAAYNEQRFASIEARLTALEGV